ncbi:thymidine phosphorylase [archaeon]|nr:thymidine phosphorylase [archaeon]
MVVNKFLIKAMNIETGGILIALLTESDAQKLDLNIGDRVLIKKGRKEITAILDIAKSSRTLAKGKVGLFQEALKHLNAKSTDQVSIHFAGKPKSLQYIKEKLHGKQLSGKELHQIIDDITNDRLTDIEKTAFVMGGYMNGFSVKETVAMTKAMVETGEQLKFNGIVLDKHCIGGVPNNRTTMIVGPIIAAAGLIMPKTSSRAITSPAGTADTMECLARVELPKNKIEKVIKKCGVALVHGGSVNLAPADDKIIEIERPLAIDAEGQLLASVMAKKHSVGAKIVLIDIPMGPSTKAKNRSDANKLKKKFVMLGKALGIKVKVIVTDGSQPIGNGVGPLLEAKDVITILKNEDHAPTDLKEKSLKMAGILLELSKKVKKGKGYHRAKYLLESGLAWQKMQEIIKMQGPQKMPSLGKYSFNVKAHRKGKVKAIDNLTIAKLARTCGAPFDKGTGLFIYKKKKDKVEEGEILFTLYAESKDKLNLAKKILIDQEAYLIK